MHTAEKGNLKGQSMLSEKKKACDKGGLGEICDSNRSSRAGENVRMSIILLSAVDPAAAHRGARRRDPSAYAEPPRIPPTVYGH